MKINKLLLEIFDDLEDCEMKSPQDVIDRITSHKNYKQVLLLVKNSDKSAKSVYDLTIETIGDEDLDIWVATLLLVLVNAEREHYATLVSRVLSGAQSGKWSQTLALSYLIKLGLEKHDKTIRITA